MKAFRICIYGLVIASLILSVSQVQAAGLGEGKSSPSHLTRQEWQSEQATDLQKYIRDTLTERESLGLPVPSAVQYDYSTEQEPVAAQRRALDDRPAMTQRVVKASTTFEFANPQEAGYEQWPDLVVEDFVPEGLEGKPLVGNYNDPYRKMLEEKFPGFENQYAFGQEPRRYTIEETLVITYPDPSALLDDFTLNSLEAAEELLLGFTYSGPHIDYSIGDSLEACDPIFGLCFTVYSFRAGFALDWVLGLRLPVEVTLSGPGQMISGTGENLSTTLLPADWSADQYAGVGVAAEDGNEFVMRMEFFAGVQAVLLDVNVCPSCYRSFDEDQSSSFATPFGPGEAFNLPSLNVDFPWDLGFAAFTLGLNFTPMVGSSQITADWQAVPGCDASGAGQVTYTEPGVPVSFGPVQPCSTGPGAVAEVELSNFRYYFNQFLIDISTSLSFDLFGYGVWSGSLSIATINLGGIFGGVYMGVHRQCDFAFNCTEIATNKSVALAMPVVDNQPPVTQASLVGLPGNNGWWRSDVEVTLLAEDGPPGCASGMMQSYYSFNGVDWAAYSGPVVVSSDGYTVLWFYSVDQEGNPEEFKSIDLWIDKTPPLISGAATLPPNTHGWYNTSVTVHFEAEDVVSGVESLTPDQVLSSEGAGQAVTGVAVDFAGNQASFTVEPINIDLTPPIIEILAPTAGAYHHSEMLVVMWLVDEPLSGLDFEEALLDGQMVSNGQEIELLLMNPGVHHFELTVVDRAGNLSQQEVMFKVATSFDEMATATQRMCELGWIENPRFCNALANKFLTLKELAKKGQEGSVYALLQAMLAEIERQHMKGVINDQAYELLVAGINFLAHLYDR